jgi:serine/threonine protein phosphatase 1
MGLVWRSSASQTKTRRPTIPDGIRIYAIGDVHGCADLLTEVLTFVDSDLMVNPTPRSIQVFLGDYVDRGPASSEVLNCLVERSSNHECIFLKGNHETYLLKFLENPDALSEWQQLGGFETLISYRLVPSLNSRQAEQAELAKALRQNLPESHQQFLAGLKPSFTCGDFFFVHAGVMPGVPLYQQREADLLEIRDAFLYCQNDFGKIIVHGHTPVLEPEIRPNRINIDTGSYASGRLTCMIIERDKFRFVLKTRGRAKIAKLAPRAAPFTIGSESHRRS